MPYNLLLLPLLGGYLFLRWWNPTRYHALRAEKERLLILAAIPGLVSLISAFAIVTVLGAVLPCANWPNLPCIPAWWAANVPFDYLGTSLVAFALGATLWAPWNYLFCDQQVAIDKVIEQDKIPFERLLKKAQDQTKTVSVSMSNGKVYVGWVTHAFNPALPTEFIQILPLKSGYRDEKTKWVVFTTYYSEALDSLRKSIDAKFQEYETAIKEYESERAKNREPSREWDDFSKILRDDLATLENELYAMEDTADDFDIVLPVSEIMSINIFSEFVHSEHFAPPAEADYGELLIDESGEESEDRIEETALDPEREKILESMREQINYLRSLTPAENEELFKRLKAPSAREHSLDQPNEPSDPNP